MVNIPTVVPHPDFDPVSDAQALKEACRGLGTDEGTIIGILAKRTSEQRCEIVKQYKTMYGDDLVDVLKSELGGNFEELILSLLTPRLRYQAIQLHDAISGLGTDETAIIEILSIHNNEEIVKIAEEYEELYGKSLESDLKGDTSGTLKHLLVALSTGNRDESDDIDEQQAIADAEALLEAGEEHLGTVESTFNAILCQRNYKQLKLVFDEYEKLKGHPFEEGLENEFSGTVLTVLLNLVHCIRNKTDYLATKLYNSMSGLGTDERTATRIIIGRSEIDLGNIKNAFEQKYEKTLSDFIDGDFNGDYKKCLLALVD